MSWRDKYRQQYGYSWSPIVDPDEFARITAKPLFERTPFGGLDTVWVVTTLDDTGRRHDDGETGEAVVLPVVQPPDSCPQHRVE